MEERQDLLSSLPNDALVHTVSFLGSKDALQLSELNSSFCSTLSFSALHNPIPLSIPTTLYGTHNEESNSPRRSAWIPVLFPNRTHSVVLTCQWRDQGYGNRKGALFVVAVPSQDDPNETMLESIENGTIVYQSPVAPHQEESLTMSFSYCPDKAYYLWYRIGGGGGHQLRVHNLKMHTIIYDCNDQWIGQHYQALNSHGFLVADSNDLALGMLRTLASVGQENITPEIAAHLDALFGPAGINTSASSMKALEELANALIDNKAKKLAHEAPAPAAENRRGGRTIGRVVVHNINGDGLDEEQIRAQLENAFGPGRGDGVRARVVNLGAINDMIGNNLAEAIARHEEALLNAVNGHRNEDGDDDQESVED